MTELTDRGMTLPGIRRILELEAQLAELQRECAELRAELCRYRP